MNIIAGRFIASVVIGLVLIMPLAVAFADTDSERRESEASEFFAKLSAEWWQWALSIPTSVNPQLELEPKNPKEDRCMVGQRGSIWFLAGVFGGGTATRACSVPQGKALFFPVINGVGINTPNVCDGKPESVSQVRKDAAIQIAGAANLSVTLDGVAIKIPPRVQSKVFAVSLPEDNVFDSPCATFGGVPAGVYSPAAGDGFYVLLDPLRVGDHTLHFHADSNQGFTDVTYHLTVVRVLEK